MIYIPLLYHSNYGLGGSNFETLFEHLKKYDLDTCGIVDETLFGLPEFIKYTKAYNIKPIIGTRIIISPFYDKNIKNVFAPFSEGRGRARHCLYFLIKDQPGYENLCQILTRKFVGILNRQFIKEHARGLILLSNSIPLLNEFKFAFAEMYYLLLPYHTVINPDFPPLAANEIFYVTKQEKILYKLMCTIKGNQYEHDFRMPNHLLSIGEFYKIFSGYQEAIENNRHLIEICNFLPENRGWIFPKLGECLYEILKPKVKDLMPSERCRIKYEYQIIKETGFEPYFSLVYHLKEFALSKGIGMNVRGSAASSFILYMLGLSVVNPLKNSLPFERFLNPQRAEPPDIDVDVEFTQRERLIGEIYKKFGNDYVAHVSVINRFQGRARFRNTARAYGISPQELRGIENHLGERVIEDIYNLAKKIDNYPHYFSCHPSGIVITPKPIFYYVPLYPSPAGRITHLDKDGIEMVGLVKIDILGVRGFPALYLSRDKIDLNEPNVCQLIGEGRTLGCFQIESPMVRQVLKRIKPKSLMDIANAIAVIRPGPARGGMKEKFLKRLKRDEPIEYPHQVLESALIETLGIPIYQEQILQIAHDFAGFSLSEADMLRRAMTKERATNCMKKIEELFFTRARMMGYPESEIATVWERIAAFSSFGFNKAHSITYATLAYLSAYQKLYNPLDFFCRVINNKGGYYPTHAYINEARRWGIKILPPDVNRSAIGFSVAHCPSGHSIITGLSEIKNLSISTISNILKFRPFKNPEELFYYSQPSIDEAVALIKSSALDTFDKSWPKLYFIFLNSRLKNVATQKTSNVVAPFMAHNIFTVYCYEMLTKNLPDFHDFGQDIKLKEQLKILGFLSRCHILEFFYPQRKIKIADLAEGIPGTIIGLPIAARTILAKNKRLMSFLTVDDDTGVLEVIIFPDKYKPGLYGSILQIEGALKDNSFIAEKYSNPLT